MSPSERFLKYLSRVEQISSPEDVFAIAKSCGYDGPITFHCQGGVPKRVELGKPIQVVIAPMALAVPLTRTG